MDREQLLPRRLFHCHIPRCILPRFISHAVPMAYIQPSFHRTWNTSTMKTFGLVVALFSSCVAVSTVKRYPLKPCSGSTVARIENVVAKSKMDRGQALLSFDVIVRGHLTDPELHVTVAGETLEYPKPRYKMCALVRHDLKGPPANPCDFAPDVYHAQLMVFGYQAFYLTAEGGKSDLRIEVVDNGKVVGCYSSLP
ncbi:hypothetical protein MTO96_023130 [Rhipicephalus appendiculatus]